MQRAHSRISRRRFLQNSAAAGAAAVAFPMIVPGRAFGANERLNIAAVGSGGKGEVDINGCSTENIAFLCDVDAANASRMFQAHPQAKKYTDYREMLDKEAKNIDAVLVSTPDHHHAPAALRAMRAGKHVYCQKPLTHTVYEARLMTETARQFKVATQMGQQGHSDPGLRRNVEVIRAGVLGKIKEVHIWTDRPIWPQGIAERPPEEEPPATIDWDLWLGPAPERPYSSAYAPFKWRGFWDFGTGALGDMGCHNMDLFFFALSPPAPKSVMAQSEGNTAESAPKWSVIDYDFPATDNTPAVRMTWYDGGKKPSPELAKLKELPGNGVILVGEKDTMYVPSYMGPGVLLSGTKLEDLKDVPMSLPRRPEPWDTNHYAEWIAACKGGEPSLSNFDYAGPMTEAVLLGNVAVRAGGKIDWDAKNLKVTNNEDANKLINKEYRKGWEIEPSAA